MEPSTKYPPVPKNQRRAVVLSIALFILIVAGMFIFVFLKQSEIKSTDLEAPAPISEDEGAYANIDRIDAKHFYVDGVHTVVGEVAMPTPCDLLVVEARIGESMPEQITLDFQVVNNTDFCAQVITPQRFKVSATASEAATFNALFENRVVVLNLVEALPGETPEDFELFIKG